MQKAELQNLGVSSAAYTVRTAPSRPGYMSDLSKEMLEMYFPNPIPAHLIPSIKNNTQRTETHPFRWICALYGFEMPFQILLIMSATAGFIGIWNYCIGAMVLPHLEAELLVMAGMCGILFIGAIGVLLWYKSLDLPLWHETPLERFRGFVPHGIRERAEELEVRIPNLRWVVLHTRKDPILRGDLPDGRSIFAIKW